MLGLDGTTVIEIGLLAGGAGLLLWAGFTRQRWDTLSELYWLLRDKLGPRGKHALAATTAAALAYLWWHLVFG